MQGSAECFVDKSSSLIYVSRFHYEKGLLRRKDKQSKPIPPPPLQDSVLLESGSGQHVW